MKSFRDPVDEWLKDTVGNDANTLITNLSNLTDIQYDFARAFVLCGSPKKAAERVNLPKEQNPNLLVHLPKVAACINILTARREQQLGRKTSAEIVERLRNTPMFEADDFGVSEAAVKEREAQIGKQNQPTGNLQHLSDTELLENVMNPSGSSNGIMQLPKVRLPQASSFGPEWVMERQVTLAERAMQIEPVYDKKGRPIGQFTCNYAAASKALDSVAKMLGMFTKKIEITGDLSGFKTTELDSRIQALLEKHPSLANVIDVTPEKVKVGAQ